MKMFKMVVFSLLALLLVTVRANPLQNSITYNVDRRQEPCVRQGGECMRYADCAPGNVVQMHVNLCPKQAPLDVICCYL